MKFLISTTPYLIGLRTFSSTSEYNDSDITKEIKELNESFHPFPPLMERIKNSVFRKINRLGFIANKNRLNKSNLLRLMTSSLEKTFGITSPDTGKKIIEAELEKENVYCYFDDRSCDIQLLRV